jgi:manganese/zinc/iron transport system substrate-binding protein
MRRLLALALLLLALPIGAVALAGCSEVPVVTPEAVAHRQVRVVTTTNFITDLARRIGGDRVRVTGLMGPGVDPHLYKASAGDVKTLAEADLVLYGGLELEGKMGDVFERLGEYRPTAAVTRDIPREQLLGEPQYPDRYDPHVWFDVSMWERAARTTAASLARIDPAHAGEYRRNARAYVGELRELDAYARRRLAEIPERSRVLVTSHDAFRYLGRRYGLDVVAIQGISTATEATTADVERVAKVIAERHVRSVFVESSVPPQTIDAVLASAARQGQRAATGEELFSDAAGAEGTPEGTYVGMVRHNVDAIAEGLR